MAKVTITDLNSVAPSEACAAQVKGGPAFDAFLEIDGIKGETKDRLPSEQFALNFTKL